MEPLKAGWDSSGAGGPPCSWQNPFTAGPKPLPKPRGSGLGAALPGGAARGVQAAAAPLPQLTPHQLPDLKALPASGLRSSSIFRGDMTIKAGPGPLCCSADLHAPGWQCRSRVCSRGERGAHVGHVGCARCAGVPRWWSVPVLRPGAHKVPVPEEWQEGLTPLHGEPGL